MIQQCIKCIVLIVVSLLIACSGGSSENNGNSSSSTGTYTENTIVLSELVSGSANSPSIPQKLSNKVTPPTNCTYIADIYTSTGTCITPTNVIGYAEQAHVEKDNGNVPGGTRIFGQSEYDETPGTIFDGATFDLSNPGSLVTNNTLSEQYDYHDQYDSLTVSTAWYMIQFPIVISSGTKFVTMLLAKYGQPFASSDAVIGAMANCDLSSEEASYSRYQAADLLTGYSFKRGDYLFCVKDLETDTCAVNDFQWLDTTNNTLVSVRPSTPKTSHWLANKAINCSSDDPGVVNFDFGPFGFYATIAATEQFKLWSDLSHAKYSRQWPLAGAPLGDETIIADPAIAWVSPYYIYYYQDCSSGTCSSAPQEGTTLDITLAFDTTQMILVDGLSSTSIAALSNIGDALLNVHVKTQWVFDQKSINNVVGFSSKQMAGVSVQPTIMLTGATNVPPANAVTLCADINPATAPDNNC